MADKKDQSTLSRIRHHYRSLPPTERKLADLLLDFPGNMASYSATELSKLAGVSKAATTRFFRRIGYQSFNQARRIARAEQDWGSPLYKMTQQPGGELPDSFLKRHMEREMKNMAQTFESLDTGDLEYISSRLLKAKRIWLLGFRNSYVLADYTRWQLLQVRDEVHLLVSEGATLAEQIVSIGKGDIVIAVGFRRRTQRFLQALKAIHANNNQILMITEPNVGACVKYATWILNAEVSGEGPFDSYPAAISLIQLLSTSMFQQRRKSAGNRIKRIEELHDLLHDFDHKFLNP